MNWTTILNFLVNLYGTITNVTSNYKMEVLAVILNGVWLIYFDLLAKNQFGLVFFVITAVVNGLLGYKLGSKT